MDRHTACDRCYDPHERRRGSCVFSNPGRALDVGEKEEFVMAKGYYLSTNGKLYKVTTPEMKQILKNVIKGEPGTLSTDDEIAPVIDLDKLDKEAATAAFLKIEIA